MSDPGLRERKKQRMYETVSDIAVRLFMWESAHRARIGRILADQGFED